MFMKYFAIAVFLAGYLLIISLPRHRAHVSIIGALLLFAAGAITGGYPPSKVFFAINWNVMGIFVGTLVLADLFIYSRAPVVMAEHLVNRAGSVGLAILFISLMTGFISAFVENVATVLIVAPIAFALCRRVNINPVIPLISIAISSNLQGTATLIGDPPSMLLAAHAKMTFNDFFIYRSRPGIFFAVQIGAVFSYLTLWLFLRKENAKVKLEHVEKVKSWMPVHLLIAMVILLALSSFADPGFSYYSGVICIILGVLGLFWFVAEQKNSARKFLADLDWETALFLIGVFILVGALTELGWIDIIAKNLARITGQSRFTAFAVIVFVSVAVSAFVDNVPYLAAMLPVAQRLSESLAASQNGANFRTLLIFGLLIGTCLGGNITPIGASANIVACGLLKKHRHHVGFWEFVRIGLPFTIAAVVPAAIFLWLVWIR
ncbi:MAG TPA: SLC13 family permease [Candidatus Sumerlaeota bacterium]|nr:MAG: Citrate transporter [candidate division BRC1 bacterium ADurb.Bin183]HOE62680.1 SLC13 family permease [Candidatus Sumerlaeota bacterium]HRR29986.1 SLC13 family permease [Candidatus Sumerlaeia bacterium]HON49440.1 SLC13 family permease [Candidatus Sumerlaeota bacterium]HOR64810.1 SLC13 family permease [Candidatus Sumerlaeota bacterium]